MKQNLLQFLYILNYFSISPDALQIIKQSVIAGENVYDQIAVIHQDPSGSLIALDLTALMTGFAEFFLYIICHCLYLAGVASVCDDKVISQSGYGSGSSAASQM